jgi:hypothetical protein
MSSLWNCEILMSRLVIISILHKYSITLLRILAGLMDDLIGRQAT